MPEQTKRTRVLVNGLHAKSGGGVTYLRNVLPLFGANPALDVHLVIHADQREIFQNCDDGIQIHYVDFSTGFFRLLLWEQFALPMKMRRIGADVMFSPGNFGPLMIRRQVILLRNALAVGWQEQRFVQRLYWIMLSWATWLSLIVAKRAIAVSGYAAQTIAPQWMHRKIDIIHHGVSELFRAPAGLDANKRENYFLMVSDIYIQKNIHTVIDALAQVREKHPHVLLRIAGSVLDPVYYDRLCAQIERLKLTQNIEFLGSHPPEEIKRLYASCRAMVFASTVEAFGNPLLEAMASACPVISSNTAAMPEVAGDAVLYFAPDDAAELASKMETVLTDDSLCADLSERAVKRAQDFSWVKTAEQTAHILIETAPGN